MIASLSPRVSELARIERRAMLKWSALILGLLLSGIITSVGGAMIALHNRPMVEQDYYNKALHWDDEMALADASAALGWKTDLSVGSSVTSEGSRALMIHLFDKSGTPIDNATVAIGFFHRAKPLDLQQVELKSVGGGLYAASVPLNRVGIWEFRLTARRPATTPAGAAKPDEMFIQSLQKDLLE